MKPTPEKSKKNKVKTLKLDGFSVLLVCEAYKGKTELVEIHPGKSREAARRECRDRNDNYKLYRPDGMKAVVVKNAYLKYE